MRPDAKAVEAMESAPLKPQAAARAEPARGGNVKAEDPEVIGTLTQNPAAPVLVDVTAYEDPVVIERAELRRLHEAFVAADRSQGSGGTGAVDPVGPGPREDGFKPAENNGV